MYQKSQNTQQAFYSFKKTLLNVLERLQERAATSLVHMSYWRRRDRKDAFFNSPCPPYTTTIRRQERNASLVFRLTTLWNIKLLISSALHSNKCLLRRCSRLLLFTSIQP